MMLNGDWLIPFLENSMTDGWGVTYMIQDAGMASDLGGNAVAATTDTKVPRRPPTFSSFSPARRK